MKRNLRIEKNLGPNATQAERDKTYAFTDFLLQLGEKRIASIPNTDLIRIPDEYTYNGDIESFIDSIYPNIATSTDEADITDRAILATKNKEDNTINELALAKMTASILLLLTVLIQTYTFRQSS